MQTSHSRVAQNTLVSLFTARDAVTWVRDKLPFVAWSYSCPSSAAAAVFWVSLFQGDGSFGKSMSPMTWTIL